MEDNDSAYTTWQLIAGKQAEDMQCFSQNLNTASVVVAALKIHSPMLASSIPVSPSLTTLVDHLILFDSSDTRMS